MEVNEKTTGSGLQIPRDKDGSLKSRKTYHQFLKQEAGQKSLDKFSF